MSESETQNSFRDQVHQAIKRCTEAVDNVRNRLPQNATFSAKQDNEHRAHYEFLDQLPILCDPASFQLYVACIAHGVVLAVIDPVDIGRYCHLAQTAMSAWKLANPTARKQQEEAYPPLPKGNHPEDEEAREAARMLPDRKTQNELYKNLRHRGIPVPSPIDLRNNPLVALFFCDLAQNHLDKLPPSDEEPLQESGQQPLEEPSQAA